MEGRCSGRRSVPVQVNRDQCWDHIPDINAVGLVNLQITPKLEELQTVRKGVRK